MNTFLRSLNLSNNNTLSDVLENCHKINNYLALKWQTKLCYDDVESVLKAAIYVEEIIAMFGGQVLLSALQAQYPEQRDSECMQGDLLQTNEYMTHVLAKILQTPAGYGHLPAIELILRAIYEAEHIERLVAQAHDKMPAKAEPNDRLLVAVSQIFQLAEAKIPAAIDSLLHEMHFSLLGHVFLVPHASAYFAHCSIISDSICKKLSAFAIPVHFVSSMQQTVAYSAEGRAFYWRCLGNQMFARHLRNFLLKYLKAGEGTYVLDNICYLFSEALAIESPCRLAYQNALNRAEIPQYNLALLQRQSIIFNS